jgi:uncharacterized damage-inducible protein DinB
MSIAAAILAEFERESALTRKTLDRVPEDRFEWKPHDRSMTLGRLASHLAETPSWCSMMMTSDQLELTPDMKPFAAGSRSELLGKFDQNVAEMKQALEGQTDEKLATAWRLISDGKTVLEMPRAALLRSFILNHSVHHRGQLTVYLRLLGVPVPAIYGPSADEER